MNIALTLSRHTSNSLASLLTLPFHYVLGLYNTLLKAAAEEKKQEGGQQGSGMPGMSGYRMPTSVSLSNPAVGSTNIRF
jgi:hypothetical protein